MAFHDKARGRGAGVDRAREKTTEGRSLLIGAPHEGARQSELWVSHTHTPGTLEFVCDFTKIGHLNVLMPTTMDADATMNEDPDDLAAAFFRREAEKERLKNTLPVMDWVNIIRATNEVKSETDKIIDPSSWLVKTMPPEPTKRGGSSGITGIHVLDPMPKK
ncbi:hypothetical protein THAOC_24861 [Thalassiosira oceanica]|uniref:Uncharacterized protein n=1 Tax=Thalassiosira oceanica TaxID=159749 RepID=K0RQN5_THAOC|nr:hypothetical protein THAOC_24861 [Thalassiosira oceanica]|eukprot:EJK55410.1 hypothetical protein THAOC_24861 [Thalassiosira oceanica]